MTLSTDDQLSEIDSHLGVHLGVTGGDEEPARPFPWSLRFVVVTKEKSIRYNPTKMKSPRCLRKPLAVSKLKIFHRNNPSQNEKALAH
jgi:hypothetical protein